MKESTLRRLIREEAKGMLQEKVDRSILDDMTTQEVGGFAGALMMLGFGGGINDLDRLERIEGSPSKIIAEGPISMPYTLDISELSYGGGQNAVEMAHEDTPEEIDIKEVSVGNGKLRIVFLDWRGV